MDNTTHMCWICGRALGKRTQAHHIVPKSKGGRVTVPVHAICHRKIHTVFSNKDLALLNGDITAINAHPEMDTFIRWIARKPPDFYAPTRRAKR